MNNNILVDEFRGTDELYCAEVISDNNEVDGGYITDTPFKLAPVAEIARTTETSSETKYYDNVPASTINAEGADTITLTVPVLPISVLGLITGKKVDADTGALFDGESKPKYFALGYRLGLTDGTYRYVWRYKGSFAIPDETSATKNGGTDANNQSLTYTGISTMHKFTKAVDEQGNPMTQKALVVDERDDKADLTGFFNTVVTCDTLQPKNPEPTPTSYNITNNLTHCTTSNDASTIVENTAYSATLSADAGYTLGAITVTMGGTDISSTAVVGSAISIASVTGDLVISCEATEVHTVTNNLTHCTTSNDATSVADEASYNATITADDTYTLGTITVTMGGEDISATAVTDSTIAIASVTGDLVITCEATQ